MDENAVDASAAVPSVMSMKVQRAELPATLAGHEAARDFFSPCFMGPDARSRELLWVAHVDDRARCIHLGRYADGREGAVDVPVRQIIADASRFGSAGVVLAHNHPSGDPTPSAADCLATRKLTRAAEAIDLAVIDHLVFAARGECRSLRRMGLL
jgi:DNA repair protein RadC